MDKPSLNRHESDRETKIIALMNRLCIVDQSLQDMLPKIDAKLTSLHELIRKNRKDHLTVEEVAELTGRSAYTVRRWIQERRLTAIRLSEGGPRGKLLISRTEVERLIADGKGGNVPASALSNQPITNLHN